MPINLVSVDPVSKIDPSVLCNQDSFRAWKDLLYEFKIYE